VANHHNGADNNEVTIATIVPIVVDLSASSSVALTTVTPAEYPTLLRYWLIVTSQPSRVSAAMLASILAATPTSAPM